MAYGRKYQRKRKSTVAKMAKGKSTQIQALAKSVRSLQLASRGQHQYLNYFQGASRDNINSPVLAVNLCNFSAMGAIFGTDANDGQNPKIVHQSFGIDAYVSLENTINNEEDTITMTAFLVSLKDDIGGAFNPTTGALTIANGSHYVIQNGLCMLNKKIFNIHKVKRKVITNHGTPLANPSAQTQSGTDFRFYWKHSPRSLITNPVGEWTSLSSALDPSKQYYMLFFNDNSVADLESPCVSYSIVHTMKTVV